MPTDNPQGFTDIRCSHGVCQLTGDFTAVETYIRRTRRVGQDLRVRATGHDSPVDQDSSLDGWEHLVFPGMGTGD